MSGHHPPLTADEVVKALVMLGFVYRKPSGGGSSHDHYVGTFRGKFRKVTVDKPKAPFSHDLIKSMAKQAGLSKAELYAAVKGNRPTDWPDTPSPSGTSQ